MKTSIVWVVLMACFVSAYPQFRNVLLDSGHYGADRYPIEPSVAISFKDPKIMVAGSAFGEVYFSADGGSTWENAVLKSNPGVYEKPFLISDYAGNFYRFLSAFSSD
jgi:hypothetical protein